MRQVVALERVAHLASSRWMTTAQARVRLAAQRSQDEADPRNTTGGISARFGVDTNEHSEIGTASMGPYALARCQGMTT